MMVERAYEPPSIRRRRTYEGYGGSMGLRTLIDARMDMMRQQVGIHIAQSDGNGNMAVLVPQWRMVEPGTINTEEPLYLNEHDAARLAESLEPITGRGRERREWERRYEEARQECRSLSNQLEVARDRTDDLADQVAFLRRQVSFLNRELRDANRERRGEPVAPEPPSSEFRG